jgi:hypothetical protein
MKTRQWKVYGRDGHRQKISFEPSVVYDWSKDGITRIVELVNSDKSGTNEYTIIRITRNTEELCRAELDGQISDGVFENVAVGKVEEMSEEEFAALSDSLGKRVWLVLEEIDQSEYTEGKHYCSAAPATTVLAACATEKEAQKLLTFVKDTAEDWDGEVPMDEDPDDYDPRSWRIEAVPHLEKHQDLSRVSEKELWAELSRRYQNNPLKASLAASWPAVVVPDEAIDTIRRMFKAFDVSCYSSGIAIKQSVFNKLGELKNRFYDLGGEVDYVMDDPDFRMEIVEGNHPVLVDLWEAIGLPNDQYPFWNNAAANPSGEEAP